VAAASSENRFPLSPSRRSSITLQINGNIARVHTSPQALHIDEFALFFQIYSLLTVRIFPASFYPHCCGKWLWRWYLLHLWVPGIGQDHTKSLLLSLLAGNCNRAGLAGGRKCRQSGPGQSPGPACRASGRGETGGTSGPVAHVPGSPAEGEPFQRLAAPSNWAILRRT